MTEELTRENWRKLRWSRRMLEVRNPYQHFAGTLERNRQIGRRGCRWDSTAAQDFED
jgi:hypothetical protein